VALKIKEALEQGERNPVLIFDDSTSELVEVDLRGSAEEVLGRLAGPSEHEQTRGPGRPKLGVVAREVTLLPRHWEWLSQQPGGASVALRKLLEEARRVNADKDRQRQAEEAAYRFMSAMAGNEPGYEEALRALFGGNRVRFEEMVARWPQDVREHAIGLAAAAFGATSPG
jgi:hypothetical protein